VKSLAGKSDENKPMKILVTGTTGNIGAKLVPRLLALGHQVTCIARNPEKGHHLAGGCA
jgi:uncharacterized protein YbjT (DUF2867 family)